MNGHTPGEWIARPDPDGGPNDWCIGLNDDVSPVDCIAVCTRRDAPLLAAAPRMLEALQAILPFIPITSAAEGGASAYSDNVRAADKVRAAIAAATGETK